MRVVDSVIFVGWLGFWVYWFVASFGVKGTGQSTWRRFAALRIGVLLVVLLLLRGRVLKGHLVITSPWLEGLGLAIFVLGLALAVWARLYLGRNWGMPMSQKEDPELVTTGPYAKVRHPIYTGIILGMVGTAIAISPYWLVAVVLISVYFIYSAVVEERNMARAFPDTYEEYKQSSRMLIPFVF